MTGLEIIAKMKLLDLPKGQYVVFGSCPMALAGIRESNDIDFYVTESLLEEFKKKGWKQDDKGPKDKPYANGVFEAHANWDFSPYAPTLEHLLETAIVADGIPFASLDEVRRWKADSGGTKNETDVALIGLYLESVKANPKVAELFTAWRTYLSTVKDWQTLVEGFKPHVDGCGRIYELPNPTARGNESFAIADMRGLEFSDPHKHTNNEFETYFILEGSGRVAVGDKIVEIRPGLSLVTPPDTFHGTYSPNKDLVLAVVNTPPFSSGNSKMLSSLDAKEMQHRLKS